MKRFLLFTSLLFTLFNCSDELQFNEHAFQATKDKELWKASDFSVSVDEDGYLSITGALNNEVVTLNVESTEIGVYSLTNANSTAWYENEDGKGFTTEYRGNGEVMIERYDVVNQTFTGSFRFNAFSSDGEVVNFINGVFYQVPVVVKTEVEYEGDLKASVDDSQLEANEVNTINENGMIKVKGMDVDGSYIELRIPETTMIGSYNLNEQSVSGTYAVYGYANGVTSAAQYGTLFINEHDAVSGLIKGSFTFTTLLPNSVSVENGSFTAYY